MSSTATEEEADSELSQGGPAEACWRNIRKWWAPQDGPHALSPMALQLAGACLGLLSGVVTGVYMELLDFFINLVWVRLPAAIFHEDSQGCPAFIILACVFGGLLYSLLDLVLPTPGTLPEWVDEIHFDPLGNRLNRLISVFVLSLITTVFGFSSGPEVPMLVVGAVMGSSMARWLQQPSPEARVLCLAGSAACLSGFFGLVVSGALFALELPHSSGGLQFYEALLPCIWASLAAAFVSKTVQREMFEGRWPYDEVANESMDMMLLVPLVVAVIGTLFAVLFVIVTHWGKHRALAMKHRVAKATGRHWLAPFLLRLVAGLLTGAIGCAFPQTLFWGELSLPTATSQQKFPLRTLGNGPLVSWAWVPTGPTITALDAFLVALAKALAITVGVIGNFCGGIIFPLVFAGGYLGMSLSALNPIFKRNSALVIQCAMGVVNAAPTKTPLATILMISVTPATIAGLSRDGQQIIGLTMPLLTLAVYLSIFLSQLLGSHGRYCVVQRDREDLQLLPLSSVSTESHEKACHSRARPCSLDVEYLGLQHRTKSCPVILQHRQLNPEELPCPVGESDHGAWESP